MNKRRPHAGASGFTLIELLVAIAIAVILLMIGVPSFVTFQRNSELTSATNTLVAAINAARGEAMKRSMSALIVPASGSDWGTGWTVFVDVDRDRRYDESKDVTILKQGALQSYFSASAQSGDGSATDYLMFDASGYSQTVGTAAFRSVTLSIQRSDLADAALKEQTRLIVIAVTGRVRVCKPATDTTCVTTATE
ncbi:GspH/FimT family pseudopilin [Variovorax sp. JS1663]|uniref:GspH/FimT family pseudopilin n=1 Tax=Variovorax sp. JS1663 TaxID=1851577 RepID=UPI000B346F6F|nr:GspH/FimT family pseudopilin [Variovorax sp. JS1663]OUM04123.1 hypothetical protein A8M77_02380 [Variovorax sp. JS1663]